MGDTCIKNMAWQTVWRFPPLLYSVTCFEYLALPLFLGVFFDICARFYAVNAALHSKKRLINQVPHNEDSERSRQIQLINYYWYSYGIAIERSGTGWQASYEAIDSNGVRSTEYIKCGLFSDLEYEITMLLGAELSWDGVERRTSSGVCQQA